MFAPVRFPAEGWAPLLAGFAWNATAVVAGFPWALPAFVPGTFLLSAGAGMLLHPGDRRLSHFAALGGVLGVLFAIFVLPFAGATALLLALLSASSFLAAGYHALRLDAHPEGVPDPVPTLRLSAEVGLDEAVLGSMVFTQLFPTAEDHVRVRREVDEACERFAAEGWLEKPIAYHRTPPDPGQGQLRTRRVRSIDFEHLSFPSEYEPREGEPGRARWLGYAANRTAHAWVLRGDPERPWLVGVHGYRMGHPLIDFGAFDPRFYHERLGLNLLLPILPLHGPRRIRRRSGDGFLEGDVLDTIHAEAQAVWDLRRMVAWVRSRSDAAIGVYGISLGGYNAALLSCFDERLACVIAGIPVTDFARTFFRHGGPWQERVALHSGMSQERMAEVLQVVSPLVLDARVPLEHRAVFGGVADRLVPPDQVRDLWLHWNRPAIEWYQGAHLTFSGHPRVRKLIGATLRGAGLTGGDPA